MISAKTVDEINILQAAMAAMSDAVAALAGGADFVIVDGNRIPAVTGPPRSRTYPRPALSNPNKYPR